MTARSIFATVNGSNFTVSIYLGNGDGTFTAGQQYASIFGARNLGVSDLDGDGNPDISSAPPICMGSARITTPMAMPTSC
jgi:hypothetical protein